MKGYSSFFAPTPTAYVKRSRLFQATYAKTKVIIGTSDPLNLFDTHRLVRHCRANDFGEICSHISSTRCGSRNGIVKSSWSSIHLGSYTFHNHKTSSGYTGSGDAWSGDVWLLPHISESRHKRAPHTRLMIRTKFMILHRTEGISGRSILHLSERLVSAFATTV